MYLQLIGEVIHAISDMVGICHLPGEGHAWPRVLQHTQQVTLIHVFLNQQQWVVPVINKIILDQAGQVGSNYHPWRVPMFDTSNGQAQTQTIVLANIG